MIRDRSVAYPFLIIAVIMVLYANHKGPHTALLDLLCGVACTFVGGIIGSIVEIERGRTK